jgi:hypothetical protein
MACNITDNILLDCIDGLGGIKAAWVGTNVAITSSVGGTCGIVTGGTGSGTLFEFQFPKDTGSYTETTNIAPAAGTVFYQQDLALVFNKMDACKRDQLLLLAKNRDIKAIFQDSNDKYWLIGLTRGAQISAGGAVTGVAPGDANQYTVTISGQEPEGALELASPTVFAGVTITNA